MVLLLRLPFHRFLPCSTVDWNSHSPHVFGKSARVPEEEADKRRQYKTFPQDQTIGNPTFLKIIVNSGTLASTRLVILK